VGFAAEDGSEGTSMDGWKDGWKGGTEMDLSSISSPTTMGYSPQLRFIPPRTIPNLIPPKPCPVMSCHVSERPLHR
jgi:hypothetical protein